MSIEKDRKDDEYRYDTWMESLKQKQNKSNIKSPKEELDDLFVTFGKIFGNNN